MSSTLYQDTLYRFYLEDELRELFQGWKLHALETRSWIESPHGSFRPYEHQHTSWVVLAEA